ncbi:GspH/FimT family pseudopilin [Methylolobus aquaticus]
MSTVIAAPMRRPITWVTVFIVLGLALLLPFAMSRDRVDQVMLKVQLAQNADDYHRALLMAQSIARKEHRTIGVNVTPIGWTIFDDQVAPPGQQDRSDETIQSSSWSAGVKLGTSIPDGRFYFDPNGTCQISSTVVCGPETSTDPEAAVPVITITSDTRRICTIYFDAQGLPASACDDF